MFCKGRKNTLNIPIDASFTPNCDYILSGSSDGNVFVFSNNKKDLRKTAITNEKCERKVAELQSMQPEAITAVEMNSKYLLMATASSYVAFWAPSSYEWISNSRHQTKISIRNMQILFAIYLMRHNIQNEINSFKIYWLVDRFCLILSILGKTNWRLFLIAKSYAYKLHYHEVTMNQFKIF